MQLPLTDKERGLESPGSGADITPATRPATGADARGTGAGSRSTLQQEEPYASRGGPLAQMTASLERAKQARAEEWKKRDEWYANLEQEMRIREGSFDGGNAARLVHNLHQEKVEGGRKRGLGYGGAWLVNQAEAYSTDPDVQEFFVKKGKQALDRRGLVMMSCLTMYEASLPAYIDGATRSTMATPEERTRQLQVFQEALKNAVDARGTGKQFVFGGRGTVFLEGLRKDSGFETLHIDGVRDKTYWNFQNYTSDKGTRESRFVPNEPAPVTGADTGKVIDTRVAIDRFVKLGKEMSPESTRLWNALGRVEFAVGVADSGYHTFVLSAGKVYEVHWDKGPTSTNLTEASDLDSFFKHWGSGVIAVPPGILKPAADPK
jgi:hypothetical protein